MRKTHPCLVEYENLPPEQRAKDHLFKAIVDALAPFCEEGPQLLPDPKLNLPVQGPIVPLLDESDILRKEFAATLSRCTPPPGYYIVGERLIRRD